MSVRWAILVCFLATAFADCTLPTFGVGVSGSGLCVSGGNLPASQSCSVSCNSSFSAISGTTSYNCSTTSTLTSASLICMASCQLNLPRSLMGVGATACPTSGYLTRGTSCKVQCDVANGFSTAFMGSDVYSCSAGGGPNGGKLTEATLRCTPCVLPTPLPIANTDTASGCQAGALLATSCNVVCNANYTPISNGQFTCTDGQLIAPPGGVSCQAQQCPIPVRTGLIPVGCGGSINPGASCEMQCASGYVSVSGNGTVNCVSLVADGPSLVCMPAPCNFSFGVAATSTLVDSCVDGGTLQSGQSCSLKCASGYEPMGSSADASCLRGLLTININCQPARCVFPSSFPTGVRTGSTNGCILGEILDSSEACNQHCEASYNPQTDKLFTCNQGAITAPSPVPWCTPDSCSTAIPAGMSGDAAGPHGRACSGAQLQSGNSCDVKCNSPLVPSAMGTFYFSCFVGDLTNSPTGQCLGIGGCYFPSNPSYRVGGGPGTCSGNPLANSSQCTVQCNTGYTGNASLSNTFSCLNGQLSSPARICTPAACTLPTMGAGVTGCVSGASLASGASCSMGCAAGSVLTDSNLAGSQYQCSLGTLSQSPQPFAPLSFCAPLTCVVPAVPQQGYTFTTSFLVFDRCVAGNALTNSSKCTLVCATNYTSTGAVGVRCLSGVLEYSGCVPENCVYNAPGAAVTIGWQGTTSGPCGQACSLSQQPVTLNSNTCCSYECMAGYTLSAGAFKLSCPVPPDCTQGNCQTVPRAPSLVCSPNPCTLPLDLGVGVSESFGCVPGAALASGGSCNVGCASTHYQASGTTLYSCNLGILTNATLLCIERNCSLPSPLPNQLSGLVSGPNNASCTPNGVILSGHACDIRCASPLSESPNSGTRIYSCVTGVRTDPTIVCLSDAQCLLPIAANVGIQGGAAPACTFPGFLNNNTFCNIKCSPGYTAVNNLNVNDTTYSCLNGVLDAGLMSCSPDPCTVTFAAPETATGGTCVNRSTLTSGGSCTTACLAGYTQMTITHACSLGQHTTSGTCVPASCTLPASFAVGVETSCVKGGQLSSGASCTVTCANGYGKDSGSTAYNCSYGNLTAATLTCQPLSCPVSLGPSVIGDNSTGKPCVTGQAVASGDHCYVKCAAGFAGPTAYMRSCSLGSFAPSASISCSSAIDCTLPAAFGTNVVSVPTNPCSAPGGMLAANAVCEVQCDPAGFYTAVGSVGPDPEHFRFRCCAGGVLCSAYKFQCFPRPCSLPFQLGANLNTTAGTCAPATRLDSGATCAVVCSSGYALSSAGQDKYSCQAGQLSGPGACLRVGMDCVVPDFTPSHFVGESQLDVFNCNPGQILASNSSCRVGCAKTFAADSGTRLYSCNSGVLTSPTLVCTGPPCVLPSPFRVGITSTQCEPGGVLAFGASCTVACAGPAYTPANMGSNQYTCPTDALGPTLTCTAVPCSLPLSFPSSFRFTSGTCQPGGTLPVDRQCAVVCANGYSSTGPGTNLYTCVAGFPLGIAPSLISPTLVCNPNFCSLPSAIGGYQEINCPSNSSVCSMRCAPGYNSVLSSGVIGPVTATCNENDGFYVLSGCNVDKQCNVSSAHPGYSVSCVGFITPTSCTGTTCAPGYYGLAQPICANQGTDMAFIGCTACRTACPPGLTAPPCNSSFQSPCTNCSANTFNNGTSISCSPCPVSTCSKPGASICGECSPQEVTIGGDGISDGALAAAIIVSLAVVLLIGVACYMSRRTKSRNRLERIARDSGTKNSAEMGRSSSNMTSSRKATEVLEMERGADGLWRQKSKV